MKEKIVLWLIQRFMGHQTKYVLIKKREPTKILNFTAGDFGQLFPRMTRLAEDIHESSTKNTDGLGV